VSNTFASALWGLSFIYWWAEHDAAGLNFHTGDNVAAGARPTPSKYTAYVTAANCYYVRPLGYAFKAFDIAGHGKILPVKISGAETNSNFEAHGILGDDKNIYVTLINKTWGKNARAEKISIETGDKNYKNVEVMFLAAPGNEITTTDGETLGDSRISNDAKWSGSWKSLSASGSNAVVELPPSSAAVVRLKSN
jgi:hypothetical protein